MNQADRLRDDYERELRYLRNAGAEFAAANPGLASRLELSAEQSPDPHVERLLEGFAFLAARLHRNIDNSVSDLAGSLLEQLYPHATRPVPSATIASFEPDVGKVELAAGFPIPGGTALFGNAPDGASVHFRTTQALTLWPLSVVDVDLVTEGLKELADHPDQRSVLSVRLEAPETFDLGAASLGALRFYVKGSSANAARLCDLLYGHTVQVRWRGAGQPPTTLANALPRFTGLDDSDALLPASDDTHPALRLLVEYFAFPLKFQFFDLDCSGLGTGDMQAAKPGKRIYELLFVLDIAPGAQMELEPDSLQLGCTPAVNLFARTSEPVRVNGTQSQYKLVADSHRERSTEIYSIEQLSSSAPGEKSVPLPRYFDYHGSGKQAARVFWHARRGAAFKSGLRGSDMLLTFVDPEFDPSTPATRTLLAKLLCTNRGLAETLPAGSELHGEDIGAIGKIRVLHKPSMQSQAAPDGAARWKLVSQLSLNHLSLVDGAKALDSLKELLSLNNLTGSVAAANQIGAIDSLACKRVMRYVGDDPWQGYRYGYELTLRLAERGTRGSSALLFGAVLHRFLGMFAGINTFVELRMEHHNGRELHRWTPQPGRQVVL